MYANSSSMYATGAGGSSSMYPGISSSIYTGSSSMYDTGGNSSSNVYAGGAGNMLTGNSSSSMMHTGGGYYLPPGGNKAGFGERVAEVS
jgi:hypothetical protein